MAARIASKCTDQYPHLSGVQRTTHGAAEGGDVTRALQLLLALTTTGGDPLRSATTTSSTSSAAASSTSATSATSAPTATAAAAASASTAATDTSTPATTPTTTPTPSTASAATSTTPPAPPAPLPPCPCRCCVSARGRRRADRLETNEVGAAVEANRGQEGEGEHPSKTGVRGSHERLLQRLCSSPLLGGPSRGGQR
ncbi:unnamed protein product [Closterium sp. NIES-64]|nr:unnamed protein product [Closterium sp. NIES-64]